MIETETPAGRKARGAFYTPELVARFLVDWAIRAETTRVLEPSAGDGVFLASAAARIRELSNSADLVGVELIEGEAAIARDRATAYGVEPAMIVSDFFSLSSDGLGQFDAIVGNPPWIRYHDFSGPQRLLAQMRSSEMGVEMSGLASSWAPYLIHATSFLTQPGRLAVVLPAELLQVDYAANVRRFLVDRFRSIRLIAFDTQLFGDVQVDAVLLLASQDDPPGITFERVASLAEIGQRAVARLDGVERWTSGVASGGVIDLLQDLEANDRMVRLGSLGSVDIGVVTGFNDYFIVSEPEADLYRLPAANLRPIVTRSDQLLDGVVTSEDFDGWRSIGRKVWLLSLSRGEPNGASDYLAEGDRIGVSSRYKCRMRNPWYAVPIKAPPDLFMSYMAHRMPRMAWNQAGALSTNLIHGIYLRNPLDAASIAESWDNPASALSAELEGRTYGGGVLKLETKEAERVLVPVPGTTFRLSDIERAILAEGVDIRRRDRLGRSRGRTVTRP
jgi:adenine-specific DNA-methyltransferase